MGAKNDSDDDSSSASSSKTSESSREEKEENEVEKMEEGEGEGDETSPHQDQNKSKLQQEQETAGATEAPTLSKSWSIASAHVPIFTGGKVTPCQLHEDDTSTKDAMDEDDDNSTTSSSNTNTIPCLLLPVGGDLAVVDAQKGIKLGSVRGDTNKPNFYNDEEGDDEGIDADAITTYALSENQKILITCSQNHLVRQYAFRLNHKKQDEMGPEISVSLQLQKTWGRSGHTLPVTAMEFHMSNVFLASGSVDGTVRIWDVRGGHVTHIFRPLAGGTGGGSGRLSVTCIRWLPDNANLVIAIGRDDGSTAIHNLRDKDMKHVVVLRDHLSAITCMDWWWGPNQDVETRPINAHPAVFVTAGRDAVLNLWSIDIEENGGSSSKKSSKRKKSKASTTSGNEALELPTPIYKRRHTLPIYEQIEGMAILPGVSEESLVVATAGSKGKVRIWEAILSDDREMSGFSMRIEQPASQAFGEARGGYLDLHLATMPPAVVGDASKDMHATPRLLVADAEHSLNFLSIEDNEKVGPLAVDRTIVGFNDDILDLKVIPPKSPSQYASEIVVATNSAQVRIFGLDNFSCDVLDRHTATVLCVDISPCGRYIATCGKDKKMHLWHTQSRTCVAEAVGHTEAVGSTALSRKAGNYFHTVLLPRFSLTRSV